MLTYPPKRPQAIMIYPQKNPKYPSKTTKCPQKSPEHPQKSPHKAGVPQCAACGALLNKAQPDMLGGAKT